MRREFAEFDPALVKKITDDRIPFDRKLWKVMQKLCNYSEFDLTFNLDMSPAGWSEWGHLVNFLDGEDNFFLDPDRGDPHVSIFEWSDVELLQAVNPIAADRALHGRYSAREVLKTNALAGAFEESNMKATDRYRALFPIVTKDYDSCIKEMFDGREKPPKPTTIELPVAPPPRTGDTGLDFRATLLTRDIERYTKGALDGMNAIVIHLLWAMRYALLSLQRKRFDRLKQLHDQWDKNGLLKVTVEDFPHSRAAFEQRQEAAVILETGEARNTAFQYRTPKRARQDHQKKLNEFSATEETEGQQRKKKRTEKPEDLVYTKDNVTKVYKTDGGFVDV